MDDKDSFFDVLSPYLFMRENEYDAYSESNGDFCLKVNWVKNGAH